MCVCVCVHLYIYIYIYFGFFLCRLFNTKDIILYEERWYNLTHSWGYQWVFNIPECQKVIEKELLEFELTHFVAIY